MFITFEGIDCCGKSTQSKLLWKFLKEKNSVWLTKEPGGIFQGIFREILMTYEALDEVDKLLLFLADRSCHITKIKRSLYAENKIVISDRFHDSTEAYQYKILDKLSIFFKESLKDLVCKNLVPDITFLIDISPEISLKRMEERAENNVLDIKNLDHLTKVRNNFLDIWSEQEDRKIVKINGDKDITEIHNEIVHWIKTFNNGEVKF